jgi:hypothetical protein
VLASPSNPTGTSGMTLKTFTDSFTARRRPLIDEVYLGLSHEQRFGHSALAYWASWGWRSSASTAFQMLQHDRLAPGLTVVVPGRWCRLIERIAQNLSCASTVAQQLACFGQSLAEYELW